MRVNESHGLWNETYALLTLITYSVLDWLSNSGSPNNQRDLMNVARRVKSKAVVAAALLSLAVPLAGIAAKHTRANAAITTGMVSLTFDDGWSTQYTNARPEMVSRGLIGTYYLVSQSVQESWQCCLNVAQVRQLQADGNEIGNHTVDHADLTTLAPAAIEAELLTSKAYLESTFGVAVPTFATPYGAYNATVLEQIRKVFKIHRTVNPGIVSTDSFVDQLPSNDIHAGITVASVKAMIDQAIAEKKWTILTFHEIVAAGASTGIQYNRADFVAILDYIKASGISVVTMSEGASKLAGNTTPVEVGLNIYTDNLTNGFSDYSYTPHSIAQSTLVHSGTSAISFEPDTYGALLFHASPISTSTYSDLEFWVNGGTSGGQQIVLSLRSAGALQGERNLSALIGGPIPANTWTKVTVPLAILGAGTQIEDIYFNDLTGTNQPTAYLDDIRLVPAGATPPTTAAVTTAAPATTAAPTTTPPVTEAPTTVPPTTTPPVTTTTPAPTLPTVPKATTTQPTIPAPTTPTVPPDTKKPPKVKNPKNTKPPKDSANAID
jgi:peptidoglycan/xylan/chitin deacetylase (PgdA/CDA1 family)